MVMTNLEVHRVMSNKVHGVRSTLKVPCTEKAKQLHNSCHLRVPQVEKIRKSYINHAVLGLPE